MPLDDRCQGLGIVVVNYNSADLLSEHLVRAGLAEVPAWVVVVDNSDVPHERVAAASLSAAHGWDYLDSGGNVGFGAACNSGVRRAGSWEPSISCC